MFYGDINFVPSNFEKDWSRKPGEKSSRTAQRECHAIGDPVCRSYCSVWFRSPISLP